MSGDTMNFNEALCDIVSMLCIVSLQQELRSPFWLRISDITTLIIPINAYYYLEFRSAITI